MFLFSANTLIRKLNGDVFFESYNLQELRIEKCRYLHFIDPVLFAMQDKLEKLYFSRVKLKGDQVKNAIQFLNKITLKEFTWENNMINVKLPSNTFEKFQLDVLNLVNNKITDLDFLSTTNAKKILLSYNTPIERPVNFINYTILENTEELDLSKTNINQLTGPTMKVFTNLKKLYLNGNRISKLEPSLLEQLPSLEVLHLSSNMLTYLPVELANTPLFKRQFSKNLNKNSEDTFIIVKDNPFHCNCEIAWLLEFFSIAKYVVCKTVGTLNQEKRLIDVPKNALECRRPSSPAVRYQNASIVTVNPGIDATKYQTSQQIKVI